MMSVTGIWTNNHSMVYRNSASGFTLLEVMLVIVLLGLTASMIIPSLAPTDNAALLEKEAIRLSRFLVNARDQALTKGQDLGLQLTDSGYRLLEFYKGRWRPIKHQSILSPVTLGADLSLDILPGESVWQASLALESKEGFVFAQGESPVGADQVEQDEDSDEYDNRALPQLFFWSSGEVSPARVRLSAKDNKVADSTLVLAESGMITVWDESAEF